MQEAQRWHPDRLRPLYAEFFRNVRHQPGAPVIAAQDGPGRQRRSAPGRTVRPANAQCRRGSPFVRGLRVGRRDPQGQPAGLAVLPDGARRTKSS